MEYRVLESLNIKSESNITFQISSSNLNYKKNTSLSEDTPQNTW